MRVLLLSWEYPPLLVGGLGRHVAALAEQLAADGHDVSVVTRGSTSGVTHEDVGGVRIVRAAVDPLAVDFTTETLLAWAQVAEHSMLRAALPLLRDWRPDVIHAHDWLVAQSAVTLAETCGAPLVVTMHAVEAGRHQGWLPQPLNRAIHSIERWLAQRANAVIVCAPSVREDVVRLFDLDAARVQVVPNAVDPRTWRTTARAREAARAAFDDDGPLLGYAGRLTHEKGVVTLLDALPELVRAHPGVQLAIAGTGGAETDLRAHARRRRIARRIHWLGFLPETRLAPLVAVADVVIVPSFYEPFGLIALEAAAAGSPVVVADTGGLHDLAAAGVAVASFPPGDADALATTLAKLLADPVATNRAAARATRTARRNYRHDATARATVDVYDAAIEQS